MSSNNVRGTLKYVVRHVAKAFGLAAYEVEEVLFEEPNLSLVSAFLGADGPATLLVYEQPGVEGEGDEPPARQLYLATAESDRFVERGLLVVKLRDEALTEESIAGAVHCAVIRGSPVKTLLATLSQVYLPALADAPSWAATLSEEGRHEFSTSLGRFVSTLDGAVSSLEGGVELAKPEPKYDVENKQPAFARAASQPEVVEHFERLIDSWCGKVEVLLAEDDESRAAATEESGPATELELWRARMAKFNSITEQLRGRECRAVVGTLAAAKSRALRRWRALDNAITDAANEAKDNVKYLSALEKHIEPLYAGTPAQMTESLPPLLTTVKMMLTIARYYNTTERMTTLFRKITNQLIVRCTQYLNEPGKLWEQSPHHLIERPDSWWKVPSACLVAAPNLPAWRP